MRRVRVLVVLASLAVALLPAVATADPNNEPMTFDLHIEVPNVAEAPNGDQIAITGGGVFSVHPKSVEASGGFVHFAPSGAVVGSGTWEATGLISFEFYGCGVVESLGVTLPPDFCGGALKMAVTLTPTGASLEIPAVLTIFCIIGPQAPSSHDELPEEGINLVVPGVANFNEIVFGMNLYVQTS